jgi:cobalt-zinc-cadmium efflux system membrane fusion protein
MSKAILLTSATLLALSLTACDGKSGDARSGERPAPAEAPGHANEEAAKVMPSVETETVAERPTEGRVVVTAMVHHDHYRLAAVVPRVPGRVLRVVARLGDSVERGQTLAVLDSLELGDARLALRQATVQSDFADTEYGRIAKLVEEEVLPRKELVRAEAERGKAHATAETARQRLRMLGVDPQETRGGSGTPSSFPLITPLAGLVLETTAVAGELAPADKPLFTVVDLSNVWVEGNLTDRQVGRVKVGAVAEVTVDAFPGEIFRGKVTYLAGALDPTTRTLLARVEVANRDLRLKPQMFARMAIVTGEPAMQLTVPASAVVLVQGEPSVFAFDGKDYAPRAVEPGETVGDRTVIRRGLTAGDRIAVGNVFDLKARLLKSQIGDEH